MSFWTIENIARIAGGAADPTEPIARAIGQRSVVPTGPGPLGVTIDTRGVLPGQVFIALKGERVDGHRFVAEAAGRGASMAIVSDVEAITPAPPAGFPVVVVHDAVAAMGRLASAYRDTLTGTLVVAVTGSAGKTTTTRLIAAALGGSGRLKGTHPAKSFNNAIGVPLTILNASPEDDFLVCEVGTSAPGEIDALARIVRPDVAVITSIGRAHVEFLGSVEGVAQEKSALLRHVRSGWRALADDAVGAMDDARGVMDAGPEKALRRRSGSGNPQPAETSTLNPDLRSKASLGPASVTVAGEVEHAGWRGVSGLALIPTDCDVLDEFVVGVRNLRRFGRGERADVRLGRVEMTPEGVWFEVENDMTGAGVDEARSASHPPPRPAPHFAGPKWREGGGSFFIPMLGEHNAMNAAAAIAVARHAGLSDDEIRRGLATAKGAAMRLERKRIGGIEVINDAYNANPESMRAAIATLAAVRVPEGGRRVLVLGDMLELGAGSGAAHGEVMGCVVERSAAFGLVCAVGDGMARAARGVGLRIPVVCEALFDEAAAGRVAAELRAGDVVLLKGSRGMRVERVVEELERVGA